MRPVSCSFEGLLLCIVLCYVVNISKALKIGVIGSGNWGSVVARNLARNAQHSSTTEKKVKMWVHDATLVDKINRDHQNAKYLPGVSLTNDVIATADVVESCHDADVLVFVVPHQFLPSILTDLKGKVKPSAIGVSLTKSLSFTESGPLRCSDMIKNALNLQHVAVVMGANIATDIAADSFAETTVACADISVAHTVAELFKSHQLQTQVSDDVSSVEYCGALKNIVAVGAGLCDGMGAGSSSKAALMRQGLAEMAAFCKEFDQTGQYKLETMMLSCGVADLVATCTSGRNYKCGLAFAPLLYAAHEQRVREISAGLSAGGVGCDSDVGCVGSADGVSGSECDIGFSSGISIGGMVALPQSQPHSAWLNQIRGIWHEVDNVVCKGQKPQGVGTCAEVVDCLQHHFQHCPEQVFAQYPLFSRIHDIVVDGELPTKLFEWK